MTLDATGLSRGASRSLLLEKTALENSRCHGLVPWCLTFAATRKDRPRKFQMPRACPAVRHVHCYQTRHLHVSCRCHGLAPWCLTFAATRKDPQKIPDATGLSRGASRSLLLSLDSFSNYRCIYAPANSPNLQNCRYTPWAPKACQDPHEPIRY